MNKKILGAAALLAAMALPGIASAATAIATANVNLRAGPSTSYPAVNVVPSGYDVEVYGCLSNRSWCDVSYGPQRGWMSSNYLAYVESGRRYTGERVVTHIGAPVISFSVGSYWDRHYRGRSFYRDRDRWDRDGRRGRHHDGREWRHDRDHDRGGRGDGRRDRDRREVRGDHRDRDHRRDDRRPNNRGSDDRVIFQQEFDPARN